MPKFRKKPVVIDAVQWNGSDKPFNAPPWMGDVFNEGNGVLISGCGEKLYITTLEGTMTASLGDWIIRGVNGERYPCKPDIFEATYEAVEP